MSEKKVRRISLHAGIVGDYDGAYDWIKEENFGLVENIVGFHEGAFPEDNYTVIEVVDPEYVVQLESADYWNNWVYPEGATPDDIQNELADFKDMIDRFECVLDHVTGGRMSKATYTKGAMIGVIDDRIDELIEEASAPE